MQNQFLVNKYTKWYFSIIERSHRSNRNKKEEYYENHHIIPKCDPFNGSNSKDNMVLLTAKEHYICHLLLTKMCEGLKKYKMIWALHRLSYGKSSLRKYHTSKSYELVRKLHSENVSLHHPAKKDPERFSNKMRIATSKQWENNHERKLSASLKRKEYISENREQILEQAKIASKIGAEKIKQKWKNETDWAEEQKKKMSIRSSGKNNSMYGKKIEGEHKRKLSEAASNKRWMNKNGKSVLVNLEEIENYLKDGYMRGRSILRKEDR